VVGGNISKDKKKPQLVKVVWGDAHAGAQWTRPDQMQHIRTPLEVIWFGLLVHHDEQGVQLSFGIDENDNYCGNMFVPAGMIKKITKVKY
jgi:hypothetical protein